MRVSAFTQTLRLSELTRRISDALEENFAQVYYWVIAEISNHSHYAEKDHHYLELLEKEEGRIAAKIQSVAWKQGALRIRNFEQVTKERFRNGIKVCVRVQVDYHPTFGLKLVITDVDPSFTLGQLELQRQATVTRLLRDCSDIIQKSGEVFSTLNNKLVLGKVIQRIAVLSSRSSAGYEDFIHTLAQNQFGYRFNVYNYPIAVQGEANAELVCEQLTLIANSEEIFDAVIIIRGGGADTDFILFDQFAFCRSVAGLQIPVITGIGHLKNQSLVDMLAHTAMNAPTKAAEFIIAHNRKFETSVLDEQKRIVIRTQQILQKQHSATEKANAALVSNSRLIISQHRELENHLRNKLIASSKKLLTRNKNLLNERITATSHKPQLLIAFRKQACTNVSDKILSVSRNYLLHRDRELQYHDSMCRMMDPINILKKGFALLYRNDTIITSGEDIKTGEELSVRLQDSLLNITVNNKIIDDGKETNL